MNRWAVSVMAALIGMPVVAHGAPIGGVISGGDAVIRQDGNQTHVQQQSARAVIDWQAFDLSAAESVTFSQPSAAAILLNRIHDVKPSFIDGAVTANGQVWMINPHGMLFGRNAAVDVGGLLVSAAGITNQDFLAGHDRFSIPAEPDAVIVNEGMLTAKQAGLVGLVAPRVENSGIIAAKLGKVHLASGDTFGLDLYGDGLISLEASAGLQQQLAANSGIIDAEGGRIFLTAAAAKDVVDSLVANSGILSATSTGDRQGAILMYAEGANAVPGNDAAEKGKLTGTSTTLNSGVLDVSGRNAGERGGSIQVLGDHVALLDGSVMDASGDSGLSGTTRDKALSAYREGAAGGDIRIGGDYLGLGDTPTAKNLYVDAGALILNDAFTIGDAGRSIFWSDDTTQFYGNVYARALGGMGIDPATWHARPTGTSGDGGFVETSGHHHLDAGGYVDLTASNGNRGTYFLDPNDITIYGNFAPNFQSTDGTINLAANLKLWLDASDTASVILSYSTDSLSGATATGLAGTNTLNTSVDVSGMLQAGSRIRLRGAGSVTSASTLGADTYTIASVLSLKSAS